MGWRENLALDMGMSDSVYRMVMLGLAATGLFLQASGWRPLGGPRGRRRWR
jgi:hypothetical protein